MNSLSQHLFFALLFLTASDHWRPQTNGSSAFTIRTDSAVVSSTDPSDKDKADAPVLQLSTGGSTSSNGASSPTASGTRHMSQ